MYSAPFWPSLATPRVAIGHNIARDYGRVSAGGMSSRYRLRLAMVNFFGRRNSYYIVMRPVRPAGCAVLESVEGGLRQSRTGFKRYAWGARRRALNVVLHRFWFGRCVYMKFLRRGFSGVSHVAHIFKSMIM